MSTKLIEKQFEANLWANVNLMTLCATLDEEQLTVEAAGVFGRIQPLIAHMLQGEGNYLRDLAGTNPWPADTDWDSLPISQLAEMAKQSGAALLASATTTDPEKDILFEDDDEKAEFKAWVVLNQAIHHGIEHRTQLNVLLTVLGVPHPGQSVWGFASAHGALKIEPKTKS